MIKNYVTLICIVLILSAFVNAGDSYPEKLKEGINAVNSENMESALTIFSELIEKEPARPEAYCAAAITNISVGNFTSAREYILWAIAKNKDYAQSYYLLGIVNEQLKNYYSALENYTKYMDLEPGSKKIDKILKKQDFLKEKLGR